jgi:hypothetical protein
MTRLMNCLYRDEAGFIVSAELVLVSTIVVLGLIVGLSEISININNELEDVGSAFGSITQSFCYSGACGHKGSMSGSCFQDQADNCDGQFDINCDSSSKGEQQNCRW